MAIMVMVMVMVLLAIPGLRVSMVAIAAFPVVPIMVAIMATLMVAAMPFMVASNLATIAIVAPKALRGIQSAEFEISTRAGLVQPYIEHYPSIGTGHGHHEANHNS